MTIRVGAVSVLVLGLMGCATQSGPSPDVIELKRQVLELQKSQGAQAAQIEELNNKLLVVSGGKTELKKIEQSSPEIPASESPAIKSPNTPPGNSDLSSTKDLLPALNHSNNKQKATEEEANSTDKDNMAVTTVPITKTRGGSGADKLYAQAITAAKGRQVPTLQKTVDLLMKGYKDSPHTNNALYLLGQTFFERGQYLKAAEQFEKLYKNFPDGNKAVAALFQLGVCYQKLGKSNEAEEAFQNIVSIYPGSREAMKAQKELEHTTKTARDTEEQP